MVDTAYSQRKSHDCYERAQKMHSIKSCKQAARFLGTAVKQIRERGRGGKRGEDDPVGINNHSSPVSSTIENSEAPPMKCKSALNTISIKRCRQLTPVSGSL